MANATLQALLQEYQKAVDTAPGDAVAQAVAKACFLEGCMCKLGVVGCSVPSLPVEELKRPERKELLKALVKVLGTTARRAVAAYVGKASKILLS